MAALRILGVCGGLWGGGGGGQQYVWELRLVLWEEGVGHQYWGLAINTCAVRRIGCAGCCGALIGAIAGAVGVMLLVVVFFWGRGGVLLLLLLILPSVLAITLGLAPFSFGPVVLLASAGSDMIGWSRVLPSHTLDAARSY